MSKQASYDFKSIEKKWQKHWFENNTFKTENSSQKPKYYVLDMFPYPSGEGLHVGHVEGYTATDIVARFKRMQGYNVLHPMGWDAFGLPAEQYAIKTNIHPRDSVQKNIANYKRQILSIGYSTDWSREVNTTDPAYFKWTQWIFLKLFERGLAYETYAPVNWCPVLGTILANEEVKDGLSEVGGHPVERRTIKQWVLKITEYAERLLQDLDDLDWPASTVEMQKHWIGKSVGCLVRFQVENTKLHKDLSFSVFTTRVDTLFGVSFCVLAPEHPLSLQIASSEQKDKVEAYIQTSAKRAERDRIATADGKSGLFTGAFAVHPVTSQKIPIYIADYVLMNYGTGAVMGVPAHDARDHVFAKQHKLPILKVLQSEENENEQLDSYSGDRTLIHSDFLNGLNKESACARMTAWLQERNLGEGTTSYKLRDWIFSRQRYWGEPFPLAHDVDGNIVPLSEEELPVLLPDLNEFKPSGSLSSPLATLKDWVEIERDGKKLLRETSIMPQWAGSCWYYLRYLDPNNDKEPWDLEKEKHWLPVDLYIGGAEHANLHLLYARFWHKVLYDIGLVKSKEPFKKLFHQGLILGENNEKMSKSRGNIVRPDDVIEQWGADSLRLFEMFLGPLEQIKPWNTNGISGVHRFLNRVFRFYVRDSEEGNPLQGELRLVPSSEVSKTESSLSLKKVLAKAIKKVTEDTEGLRFNTALSTMMEFINAAYKEKGMARTEAKSFLLLLAPYAPHLAEELWSVLSQDEKSHDNLGLSHVSWPSYDEALTLEDKITLAIMIDGKSRGTLEVLKEASKEEVLALAREQNFVKRYSEGKTILKEIYVPGRAINFLLGSTP